MPSKRVRGRTLLVAVACLAIAGCSSGTAPSPDPAAAQAPATTAAPGPDRQIDELVAWIAAAPAADPNGYSTFTDQNGKIVPVEPVGPAGYVFDSPTGKIKCYLGTPDLLDCRVRYRNPAPEPPNGHLNWLPSATEYTGDRADAGEFRGGAASVDMGNGNPLGYGARITVGNYSCRMDVTGLYCTRSGSKSGVQLSDQGLVPYGCLKKQPAAAGEPPTYKC
ncbi:hypothetical protein [Nocardia stercoris]|uniref:Lipoprotein LppI n=1 Tax=Nocardia stercoris TaxID=2483361 RepID=A0A3M2L5I2_9NOCA|nr:hypothetical protein [Nocardia stercoris]RMI31783.1 hypothetical protein EBN03_16470 [Nocardia stercoris]